MVAAMNRGVPGPRSRRGAAGRHDHQLERRRRRHRRTSIRRCARSRPTRRRWKSPARLPARVLELGGNAGGHPVTVRSLLVDSTSANRLAPSTISTKKGCNAAQVGTGRSTGADDTMDVEQTDFELRGARGPGQARRWRNRPPTCTSTYRGWRRGPDPRASSPVTMFWRPPAVRTSSTWAGCRPRWRDECRCRVGKYLTSMPGWTWTARRCCRLRDHVKATDADLARHTVRAHIAAALYSALGRHQLVNSTWFRNRRGPTDSPASRRAPGIRRGCAARTAGSGGP